MGVTGLRSSSSSSLPGVSSSSTSSRSAAGARSRQQRWCLAVTFLLCVAIAVLSKYESLVRDGKLIHHKGEVISKFDDLVTYPLHPKIERLDHRDHYYLIPPSSSPPTNDINHDKNHNETSSTTTQIQTENCKGVLIYFHSCQQTGLELFHLPEHRIVALDALQRGFAVFAPTSRDRRSGCYTSEDVETIPVLVEEWLTNHMLQYVPRIAIGDSSGGSFLSFVWKELNLNSVALYNTPVTYEWDLTLPTVIVTMQLDEVITTKANEYTKMLQNMNISTQLFKVKPRPFTISLCSARFPEWASSSSTLSTSSSLSSSSSSQTDFCVQALKMIRKEYPHLLDSYGYIKDNAHPLRQNDQWISLLDKLDSSFNQRSNVGIKDGVQSFSSSPYDTSKAGNGRSWFSTVIEEEMRTLAGFHAMTCEWHSEVLNFLTTNTDTKTP
jgi:hypothetical protein